MLLEGALLSPATDQFFNEAQKLIIAMNHDDVRENVKSDDLIIRFGAALLRKLGQARAADIKQWMRQLARLCVEAGCCLNELLKPYNFDHFMRSVESLCGMETVDGKVRFQIPSLALRLGHSVKKCVKVKIGKAIREESSVDKQHGEALLSK